MTSQMILLQILPRGGSGLECQVTETATALQEAGISNYVVSVAPSFQLTVALKKRGVEHLVLSLDSANPFKKYRAFHALISFIKEKRIDCIHLRAPSLKGGLQKIAKELGIPLIISFDEMIIKEKGIKGIYQRKTLQKETFLMTVSSAMKRVLVDDYQISPSRVFVSYPFIDLRRYQSDQVRQDRITAVMEKYQISPEKPILTVMGSVSQTSGHRLLLEALTCVKETEISCLFVKTKDEEELRGEKENVLLLQDQISDLPKTVTVQQIEISPEMKPLFYQLSDIVVCPTMVPLSFDRTIVEALSLGKPVVASDIPSNQEVIENEESGFLFKTGDVASLVRSLDHVLSLSLGQRKKLQCQAEKTVENLFSIRQGQKKVLDIYQKVIGLYETGKGKK